MSRVFVGLVLVAFAMSMGCDCGGGGVATPEGAAEAVLKAVQTGDSKAFMKHVDMKSIYDELKKLEAEMPEEMRSIGDKSFEEWKKEGEATPMEPEKDLEYEIVGSKIDGDTATVTVKTREKGDEEWEETTVPLKKIDGAWKLTAEGMGKIGR